MPVPVLTIRQMREWEAAAWSRGVDSRDVIRNVGRVLAARIESLTPPGARVLLLAGKGNNGEDARAAASLISGRDVDLLGVTGDLACFPALEHALRTPPTLVVDGLFGIGLSRPLEGAWLTIIRAINASGVPVLAVDIPSGLDADSGEPLGDAVRARWTLCVGAIKAGLLERRVADYVGRLELAANIGLSAEFPASDLMWTVPQDFLGLPPQRPVWGHKGTFGHALVLAGSRGYHGAAVLAAQAAQRARPGLITLITTEEAYRPVAAHLRAVMVRPGCGADPWPEGATCLLAGPGLAGRDVPASWRLRIGEFWTSSPVPMIVDASALEWLPRSPNPASAFRAITPHPGEAARLLGKSVDAIQTDRVGAVRALSRELGGCWVVLKGAQTLVGRADGPVFVNGTGNPGLAQGGSGDVLAGYLAGLAAQPLFSAAGPAAWLTYGVYMHGAAADALEAVRTNWTPEDLLEVLGTMPAVPGACSVQNTRR